MKHHFSYILNAVNCVTHNELSGHTLSEELLLPECGLSLVLLHLCLEVAYLLIEKVLIVDAGKGDVVLCAVV